jgi:hypothetical protein
MTDTQWLVPDSDVRALRALNGILSSAAWRMYFELYLSRPISMEETEEILSRVNGFGPMRAQDTVIEPTHSWWKSPIV